jgi:N-acetylmuramoyl-L-alanine amidase CwlA
VGGDKYPNSGGLLYGKATNKNTISIEMCVKNVTADKSANSPGWIITDDTLAATIELTRYLMKEYGIPADKVIRHYDVNGKPCPGVVGWNPLTGSVAAWNSFKAAIQTPDELTMACKKLAARGIIDSPDYWAKGSGYSDANTVLLIKKFAKALK